MTFLMKCLLNGAPVRILTEGAFSDLQIQFTEDLEALQAKVNRVGDFQYGNSLNPNYSAIKTDLDKFVRDLDKFSLGVQAFIDDAIKKDPNITYSKLLKDLKEKFL